MKSIVILIFGYDLVIVFMNILCFFIENLKRIGFVIIMMCGFYKIILFNERWVL